MVFWNLRVAQGQLARCAVHSLATRFLSASYAARQVVWRVAPSCSLSKSCLLEVARRAGH
ncbi:hypothetical protein A2U01_0090790, partial [Trifolium medium]|nr:hypothetical protein [Trifolium medium]